MTVQGLDRRARVKWMRLVIYGRREEVVVIGLAVGQLRARLVGWEC